LHPNFAVIRRYNNSDRYALVVALLARAFEGRSSSLVSSWPTHAGSLNREQTLELQTLLNGLGYDAGEPDGLFGSKTRGAVRGFQADQGLAADGFPTLALLDRVRVRAGIAPEPTRHPIGLQRAGIRELQRLLNRLGYGAGPADGRIGDRTRAAIRAFERARGLEVRGRATDVVLEAARAAAS
jgi:membrane-bound lytic murein transglycosylase B